MLIFFLIFPNVFSISQYFTESYKPDHDNTGIFFVFFPLQKDFDICSGLFLAFLLFFFRNILISFTCFFSKPFFVCWIIFTDHFYIYKKKKKKIIKNLLLVTLVLFSISFITIFFLRIFFIKIFFIRIFFIRILFIRIF